MPDELRGTYAVTAGHEVAAYCGSGVNAAHDILAMAAGRCRDRRDALPRFVERVGGRPGTPGRHW